MKTWELVDVPRNRKPIANKWVFLKKFDKSRVLTKYKARLMAKGFAQIPSMDFNQTFAPVVCLETLQSIVAKTVCKHWKLCQMDIKGAYLNGYLKEEVFMAQPDGFSDGMNRVCWLIKTLYGLKQSGQEWNEQLNKKLTEKGFRRLISDPCTYRHEEKGEVEIITIWVDDLMIFTNCEKAMNKTKNDLQEMFKVTDLGEPSKIVRIKINIDLKTGNIKLTQKKYIERLLQKYGLVDMNGVAVPMDPNIKFDLPNGEGDCSNSHASSLVP